MIARFFIDRPIFAASLSIVITLLGALALVQLPLTQYPPIVPPTVMVRAAYPGASAQTVAEAVAAPIEQQVNGVEDMLYMSSQCSSDGSYSLSVTFKPGVNLNFAQVLVQNRVALATPALPDVVKQAGVITRKRNPDILLIISIFSPDNRYDELYLSNFANINVKEELARIDGVSEVVQFGGQDYAMRVWLDPELLAARGLVATDLVQALREQSAQIAAGQMGGPPYVANGDGWMVDGDGKDEPLGNSYQPPTINHQPPLVAMLQLPVTTLGRLSEPEQFEQVILKANPQGGVLRVKDIGRVEMSGENSDVVGFVDGKPCTNIAAFLLPDANALDTADRIRAKLEELSHTFPEGVTYGVYFDTTPFVRESVNEVFKTLRDSVILVALVVLLFLQNWRSAIIPLVAVPVAIVGTFAVMAALGFSINTLTLFGLVLAIGIVVDDAIVVVEAVEHHMEKGLPAREATIQAMEEVSGPVIAVGCVLSAVFVPCAFISGITGAFFRQFALTIAVSTLISTFNSLTLSPALCAILLKPRGARKDPVAWLLNFSLGWFFRLFNFGFKHASALYTRLVGLALRGSVIVLVVYGGMVALTTWSFGQLPTGYIPAQDRGYLMMSIQMPEATSLERTLEAVKEIDRLTTETPGVAHTLSAAGRSFIISALGPNFGQMFIILDDFHDREDPELHSDKIAAVLRAKVAKAVPDASVGIFGPPPVSGLGTGGGFKFILEDRGDSGLQELEKQAKNLIAESNKQPQLANVFTTFRASSPQVFVDVDREKCAGLGVDIKDVYSTLQLCLGSFYVNDFNKFGRNWKVVVQAEGKFRNQPEDIARLKVRSKQGKMIPLGSLVTIEEINGPLLINRYNMYPAVTINGSIAPGISSGEAIDAVQSVAEKEMPSTMSYEWTEITFLQLQSGATAMLIFALSVVGVFLVLAALYESWSLPLAVILVVPMCLLGSLTGVALIKSDINIFTQVGFVVLVGLASKNAILIVEFAKLKRDAGVSRRQAVLEACQLRLRPILMTSVAFMFGVLPLMWSQGAGGEMRRVLGTAVFSGMLGVTLFGIFLTPVFFYVIDWLSGQALLGSPRTRWMATVVAGLFGLLACSLIEALLVVAWWQELLTLWGLVLLSLGMIIVLALMLVVHRRSGDRPVAAGLPLLGLWQRRRIPTPQGFDIKAQGRTAHPGNGDDEA